jgi:hypothetical protein
VLGHRRVGSIQDVEHHLIVAAQEPRQLGARLAHVADLSLAKALLALPHAICVQLHK